MKMTGASFGVIVEPLLQLETGMARHLNIGDDAARRLRHAGREKLFAEWDVLGQSE